MERGVAAVAAVVPAAGASVRMGRPKLLIEFDGEPLIARVVRTLLDGGVAPVVVVSPPETAPAASELIAAALGAGAVVVTPEAQPPEMRTSVELGVAELARSAEPPAAVLLAPADEPKLMATTVATLVAAWRTDPDRIAAPTHGGRRGHPVILPWTLAQTIEDLPPDVGVNALTARPDANVQEVEMGTESIHFDLDTPEDLRRALATTEGLRSCVVRLFAGARERAGTAELRVDAPEPVDVAGLRRAIVAQCPALASVLDHSRIAVDDEYADDSVAIAPGAKLAVIPPVSGG